MSRKNKIRWELLLLPVVLIFIQNVSASNVSFNALGEEDFLVGVYYNNGTLKGEYYAKQGFILDNANDYILDLGYPMNNSLMDYALYQTERGGLNLAKLLVLFFGSLIVIGYFLKK